ncbi:MAG: signal peptide peptidase SppA, partial [Lachnospiraceae bacterium]|nr:signal peptide peptidase SppA [Lachnospiraceae bacterium]
MKKKQVIAGVIAAILFVFIGVTSVGMNIMDKAMTGMMGMDSYAYGFPMGDFVGIVKVDGDMMDSVDSSYFSTGGYDHAATIEYIEALSEAENNVAILLYVNSGGGYTYIGDDLYLELMEYKEETGRPIYAYFDSIAASAAYYAAMSADE